MERRERLYEGKAKILYATEDPEVLWTEFKDDATAFNGQKKATIEGKGIYNNNISSYLFRYLAENGLPNHFIDRPADRVMLVRRLRMFPLEAVVRNIVAGSLASRLGLAEGTELSEPVVELYFKNDALGDPLLNESHIRVLRLANADEVHEIERLAVRVNDLLRPFLLKRRLELVDFKLEFGRSDGRILLGDEISPDTCRLWDTETHERLDKDRFRRDLGGVPEAYREVWERIRTNV